MICNICKTEFSPALTGGRKYCSKQCRDKSQRILRPEYVKEHKKKSSRLYREKWDSKYLFLHKERIYLRTYIRQKRVRKVTPKWADLSLIKDMYLEARYQQMEVDHIIPINSPLVCGLHWEGNLQLLSSVENKQKGNKFTIEE